MKNWKIIGIILIVILATVAISGCIGDDSSAEPVITSDDITNISENGTYSTKEDVGAYIIKYHKLPSNYMTKDEARALGWHGGSLDSYIPGMAIGGDRFTNRQEVLPTGHTYVECDINTIGSDTRGAERIVYANDTYDVYYTSDHYETFEKLN